MTRAEAVESVLVWPISAAHRFIMRQATLCAGGIALVKALSLNHWRTRLTGIPVHGVAARLIVARHPVMEHLASLSV